MNDPNWIKVDELLNQQDEVMNQMKNLNKTPEQRLYFFETKINISNSSKTNNSSDKKPVSDIEIVHEKGSSDDKLLINLLNESKAKNTNIVSTYLSKK